MGMRKLTHNEIVARQNFKAQESRLPLCVVVSDIRSLYNVGSIFRTGDGVGVEKLWLCGITGYPPQAQIAKVALEAENHVAWEYRKDARKLLAELKGKGFTIVLLEQMGESIPYEDFEPDGPVCLVVGNEIGGISDAIIDLCDVAVEIDMAGVKNSLNAAVAFGIVAYHIRNCLKTRKYSHK